ncbi:DUF5719 family protein [Oryzihumus leptocrescens]|uniref:Secreted protein n=1 Tax=Oryzihumus leptocrescens TaxID=297536 RepID=A0A542ZGG6_9MICO|nr:DUF5719 family protein [Oryzihumus leptocrescens]TQL59389.1 hypothetical protein FB474_0743 [Oryzihumus leptocrescens]
MIGLTRVVLVTAAGAGLVLAAAKAPAVDLAAPAARAATPATAAAVASTSVVCPGPETLGVDGVVPGRQTASVAALTAPQEVLPAPARSGGDGTLSLRSLASPEAAPGTAPSTSARGSALGATVSVPAAVLAAGTGSLAPGTVGAQRTLVTKGDDRGLTGSACVAPREQAWLVAGGGEAGRRERLVLANPGPNPIQVDLTVLDSAGEVTSPAAQDIVVGPYGRTVVLLDAVAGSEKSPVVGVTARGGEVAAVLSDTWLDGIVPRGGDDAVPTADPATEQVVPGVALSGRGTLRLAVPGDTEAVVQLRLLTPAGAQPLPNGGVVRVPAHSTTDVDLSGLPAGAYAVHVRADEPVLAGATVERRAAAAGPSDLAWTTATEPVRGLAGAALLPAPGVTTEVQLASVARSAVVTVTSVSPSGQVVNDTVAVPADSVATRSVTGAASVWVTPVSGQVRAATVSAVADPAGPLVSVSPLVSLPLTTTPLSVRAARD